MKLIILTGSETRHAFFRKKIAFDPRIEVLSTYCEGDELSLENRVAKNDKSTIELLNINNVAYSFNVEPRNIVATDITRSPQTLPRYDCNRFFHGQAT